MKYYAAHNTHADLLNGNRGFLNSWEISRFDSAAERAAFVEKYENKNARALTRSEAESLWKSQYTSVGKPIPPGGLFAETERFESRFWNENPGNDDN